MTNIKKLEDLISISVDSDEIWYYDSIIPTIPINQGGTIKEIKNGSKYKFVNNIELAFDYSQNTNIILNNLILCCEDRNNSDNFDFRFEFCDEKLETKAYSYGLIKDGDNIFSFKISNLNSNRLWRKVVNNKERRMISLIIPKNTKLTQFNLTQSMIVCTRPKPVGNLREGFTNI